MDHMKKMGLEHGPIDLGAVHLCIDMQRLFSEDTPWMTPWMNRVAPVVTRISQVHAASTIFTRLIPADRPENALGAWRKYWRRWSELTLSQIDPSLLTLMPELSKLVPPSTVFDKRTYSPWIDGRLHGHLRSRSCGTLVITGGESDVCVLATVLGAVDLGYRVILVTDALCSSTDNTHDAALAIYAGRFGEQIELATAEEALDSWPVAV